MNRYHATIAAFAVLAFAAATPATADDDRCGRVAAADWMSVGEITARAEAAGYTVREVERDDGCYEIKGTTTDGKRVEVKMHPATGAVVEVEDDD